MEWRQIIPAPPYASFGMALKSGVAPGGCEVRAGSRDCRLSEEALHQQLQEIKHVPTVFEEAQAIDSQLHQDFDNENAERNLVERSSICRHSAPSAMGEVSMPMMIALMTITARITFWKRLDSTMIRSFSIMTQAFTTTEFSVMWRFWRRHSR